MRLSQQLRVTPLLGHTKDLGSRRSPLRVSPAGACKRTSSPPAPLTWTPYLLCRCRSRLSRGAPKPVSLLQSPSRLPLSSPCASSHPCRQHVMVAEPNLCSQRPCVLEENQAWHVMGPRFLEFSITFEEGLVFKSKSLFKRSEGCNYVQFVTQQARGKEKILTKNEVVFS